MKYKIEITETLSKEIEVEADSESEAREIAEDIVLDWDNMHERKIKVLNGYEDFKPCYPYESFLHFEIQRRNRTPEMILAFVNNAKMKIESLDSIEGLSESAKKSELLVNKTYIFHAHKYLSSMPRYSFEL